MLCFDCHFSNQTANITLGSYVFMGFTSSQLSMKEVSSGGMGKMGVSSLEVLSCDLARLKLPLGAE